MKKTLLLNIILLIITSSAFCQEYEVKNGPVIDLSKRYILNGYLGRNDSSIYFNYLKVNYGVRTQSNVYDLMLNCFDIKTMKQKFSNEILIPKNELTEDKRFYVLNYIFLKDKCYLFAYYYKTAVVFNVDPENGNLSNEYYEVDKIENSDKSTNFSFNYAISDDSTKVLFYHQLDGYRKSKEKFSASLYDSNLKFLWKKEFVSDEADQDLELLNFQVDKDGNFYQLMKVINIKTTDKEDPDWKYQIQGYWPALGVSKAIDVDLGDSYVVNMKIGITKSGKLVCIGLYNDKYQKTKNKKNKIENSLGLFFAEITKENQKLSSIKKHEFSSNKSLNDELNNSKQVEYLSIDNKLQFFDDGTIYVFSEQEIKDISGSTTIVRLGDIVVFSLKENGELSWTTKINKLQSTYSGVGGYFEFFKDKNIYLVYNDHKSNLGLKIEDDRKLLNTMGSAVTMVSEIDAEGKFRTKQLLTDLSVKMRFVPWYSKQINSGHVLLYRKAEAGADFQFVTVTVK